MNDTPNPPPSSDLPPPASGAIEGERHVSEVAGRAPILSKRAGVGVIIAGAAIACGVIGPWVAAEQRVSFGSGAVCGRAPIAPRWSVRSWIDAGAPDVLRPRGGVHLTLV